MAKSKSTRGLFQSDNVSIFLSELLGTALLVFLGCSSCFKWTPNAALDDLQVILSFGFAVLIAVQIFGCVSGAHINPAVTVAAVIYKLISIKMAVVYIVAQCLGAFMGYGFLMTLTPKMIIESHQSFCVTKPHELVSAPKAFGIEFIATVTLIWFCCGVWDPRNAKHHDSIPIKFAFAVAGIASATAHYTGGSFNPARSLGPVLWTGDFQSHWIYWLAPLSGAAVSATIYRYVFHREIIEAEIEHNLDTIGETKA